MSLSDSHCTCPPVCSTSGRGYTSTWNPSASKNLLLGTLLLGALLLPVVLMPWGLRWCRMGHSPWNMWATALGQDLLCPSLLLTGVVAPSPLARHPSGSGRARACRDGTCPAAGGAGRQEGQRGKEAERQRLLHIGVWESACQPCSIILISPAPLLFNEQLIGAV